MCMACESNEEFMEIKDWDDFVAFSRQQAEGMQGLVDRFTKIAENEITPAPQNQVRIMDMISEELIALGLTSMFNADQLARFSRIIVNRIASQG